MTVLSKTKMEGIKMRTVIELPDGKHIIITPNANKRIIKMVNDVLHKMNA